MFMCSRKRVCVNVRVHVFFFSIAVISFPSLLVVIFFSVYIYIIFIANV